MTYQPLARKWRPQTFADLVGQEAIVTALRNALGDGRIAQAYLFSGIRGIGKTTAARVLAKALNCLGADGSAGGPASEPCDTCLVCTEIREGADLDVIEIDAATHSTVDKVRDLTESLTYGPARDRYKVVVLDEIHRLSRSAFDALLKIVEEPPPHLTFIFATTEIEKVPATVLSRCQEFHFRRVPPEPMVAHLRRICDAEGFEAGNPALRLIARASEGSVRDAVALLDQAATFGNGRLGGDDVARLVGGIDAALLSTLLEAVLAGDGARLSTTIREVEDGGSDPRQVFTHFLGFLRSALHLAQGLDPEQLDLPAEAAEDLKETAAASGYENLLRLLHLLLSSETVVRRADAPGLALEVALLRAAELPRLVRIERLAAGLPTDAAPPKPAPEAPAAAPAATSSGDSRRDVSHGRRRFGREAAREPESRPGGPARLPQRAPRNAGQHPGHRGRAGARAPTARRGPGHSAPRRRALRTRSRRRLEDDARNARRRRRRAVARRSSAAWRQRAANRTHRRRATARRQPADAPRDPRRTARPARSAVPATRNRAPAAKREGPPRPIPASAPCSTSSEAAYSTSGPGPPDCPLNEHRNSDE